MKRWEQWALHLLTVGISGSGLVYLWMKYLLSAEDPFSLINHPWQPAMLEIHLILSPLLVFLMGMILYSHIARKLRNKTRSGRRSGMLSLICFPVMVLSGYGLQTASDLVWTRALLVAHLVSGALFAATYAAHLVVKLREQSREKSGRARVLAVRIGLAPSDGRKLGAAARPAAGQFRHDRHPLPSGPALTQPSASDSHGFRIEN